MIEPPDPTDDDAGRPSLDAGLYIVATPIGNLRDITLRALDVLRAADLIAAEDTRITRKLLSAYGLGGRLVALHAHNEASQVADLLDALAAGLRVALVSDAGTPLVSDPGARLVSAAIAAGHRVMPIPGACAAVAALSVAGLPTDTFVFAGFPPPKAAARQTFLERFVSVDATLVFYETGPRLGESLAAMAAVFGARPAVMARELTKLFETVERGDLGDLARRFADGAPPKGEIVVLIGPPAPTAEPDDQALDAVLGPLLAAHGVSEAARLAADILGVARKRAYARALALRGQS